jgi:hypothetical protein
VKCAETEGGNRLLGPFGEGLEAGETVEQGVVSWNQMSRRNKIKRKIENCHSFLFTHSREKRTHMRDVTQTGSMVLTKCREKQYNAVVVEQQIESITRSRLLRMES